MRLSRVTLAVSAAGTSPRAVPLVTVVLSFVLFSYLYWGIQPQNLWSPSHVVQVRTLVSSRARDAPESLFNLAELDAVRIARSTVRAA